MKWYEVYVWNYNSKEIDFVVKRNNDIKYIQVTYLLSSKDVVEREFGNLLEYLTFSRYLN